MAASGQPAFGERCLPASRQTAVQAFAAEALDVVAAASTISSAESRGVRWPIMLSAVLIAL